MRRRLGVVGLLLGLGFLVVAILRFVFGNDGVYGVGAL